MPQRHLLMASLKAFRYLPVLIMGFLPYRKVTLKYVFKQFKPLLLSTSAAPSYRHQLKPDRPENL